MDCTERYSLSYSSFFYETAGDLVRILDRFGLSIEFYFRLSAGVSFAFRSDKCKIL